MSFTDILRTPDSVLLETGAGFESMTASGDRFTAPGITLDCADRRFTVIRSRTAPDRAPKRFKLRWRGDNRAVRLLYRDAWQRACMDIGWTIPQPEMPLPWYFLAFDGVYTRGCGVKTGGDAFAFWQVDPRGVTLWLDVRCGGAGVELTRPLVAAEIVTCLSADGETPYRTAQRFAGMLCSSPRLPARPVFGANNWYYAYGDISQETVLGDAALMGSLVDGGLRPYMLIDDGWQQNRRKGYIGGPWLPNDRFGDMAETARGIRARGCIPAIWMRPTLSEDPGLPEAWKLRRPHGLQSETGFVLDPSVPDVLNRIREDVSRVRSWGFDLIKHDFSSYDLSGMTDADAKFQVTPENWTFFDRTRTTAQIVKSLYQTIQDAAGGAYVMGCNTYNHLTAGIHEIMRSGGDTSGRVWEITRSHGIGTLALRLHQNGRFFMTDADCAAFTPKVPAEMNLRFADLIARSGTALFASITPGLLSPDELARLRRIYERAGQPADLEPLDWMTTTCPGEYLDRGDRLSYDWFTDCGGVRTFYTWFG